MWTFHFRLPGLVWWLMGLALTAMALLASKFEVSMAAAVLALVALAGGIRWMAAKRRCRHSLLVALFYEGANAKGRAEEAQRIVVDTLQAAERMRGLFADLAPGSSLSDELIADRRAEARAEDREAAEEARRLRDRR